MTLVERVCLWGLGVFGGLLVIELTVEAWARHMEDRFWARKAGLK